MSQLPKFLFQNLSFFTTVNHWNDLPDSTAEIAFAGRSNAGKSSAINTLSNRTRMAYVSKTPGRTQHINYFTITADHYLVDLPGYGFADVPDAVRTHWEKLLSRYLQERLPLCGLIIIMDSRRPLTVLDWRMLDWFVPTGRPVHVLLSKSDKLSRQEATKTLADVRAQLLKYPQCSVQLFSSLKKQGLEEAEAVMRRWLEPSVPVVDDGFMDTAG